MSEREEQFFIRAENALTSIEKAMKDLEKVKTWYKSAALAFTISFIVCVFGAGALGYKFGLMENDLATKASLKTVILLRESNETLTEAIVGLIDDNDHKVIALDFIEKYRKMDDKIFMFTGTRGTTKKDTINELDN